MKRLLTLFLLAVFLVPVLSSDSFGLAFELKKSRGGAAVTGDDLTVSVRLIGGKGAVLKPGRDVNLTFQTSRDAYVVLYNIDSEGFVHLLFPEDGTPKKVKGRKVHFLPEPGKGLYWEVGNTTGIEYVHALAVSDRDMLKEEELYFLAQSRKLAEEKKLRIDMDPFLAFNMIDEEVMVDATTAGPATDYTYFYVNKKVDYPRYLCVKCHGTDKIADPYAMECPEIVIERAVYEEDLHYPYPEIFQVRHAGEETEEEYYTSTEYAERATDEWDGDYKDEYDDDKVYLSIYYTDSDYPYRMYYPHYRYYVSYHHPFYWNWWWDFGWSFYWADYYYYHWPFYSWYGPSHYYWAYYYQWHPYRWHYWDDCCYAYRHRSIGGDRYITKRKLHYASTVNRVRRKEAIHASRLSERRIDAASRTRLDRRRMLDRSRLADRAVRRGASTRATRYRTDRTGARRSDLERRIVHGRDRASTRTRTIDRSRQPRLRKDSSGRTMQRGTDRSTRTIRRNTDRSTRSRDGDRNVKRSDTRRGSTKSRTIRRSNPRKPSRSVDRPKRRSSGSKRSSRSAVKRAPTKRPSRAVKRSAPRKRSSGSSVRRSAPRRSPSRPARSSGGRSGSSRGSRSSGGSGRSKRK